MRVIPTRTADPVTSHQGEQDVQIRASSQKYKLLEAYEEYRWRGLTDEEAAQVAELPERSCWWKRCSELREMGLITDTNEVRLGSQGSFRMVCRITEAGRALYADHQ